MKKKKREVRESNSDLTLNKLKVCRPKKQVWGFGTVPCNELKQRTIVFFLRASQN